MKLLRIVILLLLIVGVASQFIRPPLENPPVTGDLQAPPEVKAILQRACYDCHSNQTELKWFDEPAPAYWLVVKDVKDGRRVLNFSNWDSLPKGQQAAKLFESVFQIEQKGMPLSSYTFLHHGGIISAAEMSVLKQYVGSLGYRPVVDTSRQRAGDEQYSQWIGVAGAGAVKDAYNGISYSELAGWPGWQALSTTERYDNGTLRVIFGNEVVVKAIRAGQTNPFPDGAIFAKAAWDQRVDSANDGRPTIEVMGSRDGQLTGTHMAPNEIQAGAFKQVEFIIRDRKKYASSFGWGWARWVGGVAMKPYGKDASFVTECMNCHRPLDKTDHTFTFPLTDTVRLYDQAASLADSLGGLPLRGKVITSFVNSQLGTMSTLYGNDEAVRSARAGQGYTAGSVLSLVTWSQRDDPHWFGGRIPKEMESIERVQYTAGAEPQYQLYDGATLAKKPVDEEQFVQRVAYITGKKAAVMPGGR